MKKVLIISGIKWTDTYQRHQIIAEEFLSNGYTVIFLEGVPSAKFSLSKLFNRIIRYFKRNQNSNKRLGLNKNLTLVKTRFLNPEFKYCNILLLKRILPLIDNVDFVYTFLPIPIVLDIFKETQKDTKLFYDCVRNFEDWGEYSSLLLKTEKQILSLSNRVFVDSYYLANKHQKYSPIQILPSVDKKLFLKFNNSVKKIKNIRNIVYFGTLSDHIDVELINHLLQRGYTFHFFGSDLLKKKISHTNFINHGFIEDQNILFEEMVKFGDATIIPYKGNMDGVIPAKLMQSLLLPMPTFIYSFFDSNYLSDYLYTYSSIEELQFKLAKFSYEEYLIKRRKAQIFVEENTNDLLFDKIKNQL